MRIDEILEDRRPVFSFEFFPPKTDEGMENLFNAAAQLKNEEPAFVSVTYGAGGSTRDRTIAIVKRIKQELGLEAMAHFTCVDATVDELRSTLDQMREAGIENVLALRGDPPKGQTEWTATPGGLTYSTELIGLIEAEYEFTIGAACFPEVHPQAVDMESDINFLKKKVDAGAKFLITQLFFDNELYFGFVDRARAAGIDVPIIPGVMPITNFGQIKRFTEMCGASIPSHLESELAAREDDPDAVRDLGVAYATLQCSELLARGAPGIHFYVLNRAPVARSVLAALRAARPWARPLTPA
ncbi:MAG: methylenetetrahydrofolate reductase [Thermoleophilaceae bacterium]|jgi:methylenetetrahydrofolate reductase (NADPH)|nr:methylenetetrahydrofolate reductase [Thermoleophilaceae bacterium]